MTITDVNGTSTATILDGEDGTGSGDMKKATYDSNDNGIVDNAERVNNHTVLSDVPANAVFTDTTYTAGTGIAINNGVISNTQTSAEWGNITGTLSDQTDLQNALNAKANSGDIPTKLSDLNNDAGFITNTVNNLTNYYTKSNTYTKTEVDNLIGAISSLKIQVVQSLPSTNIDTSTIYLVSKTGSTGDVYNEYIYVNNAWELIGSTEVDLTNYYTKTQTDTLLSGKQASLVSGTNIKTINNESLLGNGNIDIAEGAQELTSPFYLGDLEDGTYIFPENSVMYSGTEAGEHELFAPYYNLDTASTEPETLGTGKGTLTITTGEPEGSYTGARSCRYFTLEITSEYKSWYKINGIFDSRGNTGLTYNAFLAPTFTQYESDYREVTKDGQTYKLPIVRSMANTSLPSLYRMRAPVIYSEGFGETLYLEGDGYLLVKQYIGRYEWRTKFLAILLNPDTGSWEVKSGQWGDITLQTFELEKLSIIIDSFGAQEVTWIDPSQETHQYAVGDLVTGAGMIFRCIQAHSNDTEKSYPLYAYYGTSEYWEMTTMWDVVEGLINDKQDKLISGTNIKTINNQSLLGSGNITIEGGSGASVWGSITGTLSNQTDLNTALNSKADANSIPTKTSDLTNDNGFITSYTETDPVFNASAAKNITSSDITNWNNKSDFSGSYNDLTNKPTIPDSTSDLTNDSGFITSSVNNLTNYYTKTTIDSSLSSKQDSLVSGTNIKTINNESILGSGNITISDVSVNDSYSTSTTEPYSANYVNSLNTYSTTERRIGTWKDGKPLYRITLEYSVSTGSSSHSVSSLNIDNIAKQTHQIKRYNSSYGNTDIENPYYASSTDYFRSFVRKNPDTIETRLQGNYTTYTQITTLEYTKTTD